VRRAAAESESLNLAAGATMQDSWVPRPKEKGGREMTTTLKELEQLLETATPRPWGKGVSSHHTVCKDNTFNGYRIAEFHHADDASLVDYAVNSLPTLIAALRQAREALEDQRDMWIDARDSAKELQDNWMVNFAGQNINSANPVLSNLLELEGVVMDSNQQGPTSQEEYEAAPAAVKFAMTNEELDKAIDTAARYSITLTGPGTCVPLMLDHLKKLLNIQSARAGKD
jgi:hypothetical protein